jgi:glycerol-3-phosphate dehydrogenase
MPLLRAVNVVLGRSVLDGPAIGGEVAGRFLFLVPWRGRTMIGTAYVPEDREPVSATVEGLMREAASAFPWAALKLEDIRVVHDGRVPGETDASGLWTRDRIRDHARDGAPGLLSAVGVKYTTARGVAESAVDAVVQRLGRKVEPCRTSVTPLTKAAILDGPLPDRIERAVAREMAVGLDDVVLRRLDLGTGGPPEADTLDVVAQGLARLHGWGAERLEAERRRLQDRFGLGLRA